MPYPQLNRSEVTMRPLAERKNKKRIEKDKVLPTDEVKNLSSQAREMIGRLADRIRLARQNEKSVMLTYGAHTIKNGLGPVLIQLIEEGWLTHLATNGAGIIHDWEFAYLGESSEDVRANVAHGAFGNWQETGFYLNLAILIGAMEGKGYGESVGAMIRNESLSIPSEKDLLDLAKLEMDSRPEIAASALDLLEGIRRLQIPQGPMRIEHPYKKYSIQASAYHRVPLTGHPMFGHDIIYNHPANCGAAIGRTAQRDFLAFAKSVSNIDGGVYLSVGSAVMSPMVFEKSFSMAQNIALAERRRIENHTIFVVDLAKSSWDWSKGEPPEDSPDYYLRYNKTFSRMGGTMHYLTADNRDFLLALCQELTKG